MTYSFSAVVNKEGRMFVALCPELDIASQGRTSATATKNLKEAVRLFLESASPAERSAGREAIIRRSGLSVDEFTTLL